MSTSQSRRRQGQRRRTDPEPTVPKVDSPRRRVVADPVLLRRLAELILANRRERAERKAAGDELEPAVDQESPQTAMVEEGKDP